MSGGMKGILAELLSKSRAGLRREGKAVHRHSREGGFAHVAALDKPLRLYRAVQFAFPQRHVIATIAVLTLITAVLNAIEPLLIKSVFDDLTSRQGRLLVLSIIALGWLALAREAFEGTSNWLTWRARISLQYALLEATIGKLHKMPLQMQRSEGNGHGGRGEVPLPARRLGRQSGRRPWRRDG